MPYKTHWPRHAFNWITMRRQKGVWWHTCLSSSERIWACSVPTVKHWTGSRNTAVLKAKDIGIPVQDIRRGGVRLFPSLPCLSNFCKNHYMEDPTFLYGSEWPVNAAIKSRRLFKFLYFVPAFWAEIMLDWMVWNPLLSYMMLPPLWVYCSGIWHH